MNDTAIANATQADTAQQVADAVRKHLLGKRPGGAILEVVPEGIRQDREWWYVPVRPSLRLTKRFEFYEVLAGVESELQKSEHLTVLLLPSIPESEASAD